MSKPETCEWQDCNEPPRVAVRLDGEDYWFCGNEHAQEFWDWIAESGNY